MQGCFKGVCKCLITYFLFNFLFVHGNIYIGKTYPIRATPEIYAIKTTKKYLSFFKKLYKTNDMISLNIYLKSLKDFVSANV